MKEENFLTLARVRLDSARECLREAETLLLGEFYKGANNQAFYKFFINF